jgi:hypothetical protein
MKAKFQHSYYLCYKYILFGGWDEEKRRDVAELLYEGLSEDPIPIYSVVIATNLWVLIPNQDELKKKKPILFNLSMLDMS